MSDHDSDVAAVLEDVLTACCDASIRDEMVVRVLAHLAWHRIACVRLPEGVEVEHGARLVLKKPFTREGHARGCSLDGHPCDCTMRSKSFYVIEDTP